MAEGIDFEGLSNRLRKERQVAPDRLTKLDPSFYADAEQYIRKLAETAHRESQANPAGAKAMLLEDELRNARRILEDFYDLREHKILALAVASARGALSDHAGMTKGEQELFDTLVRTLRDARRHLLRHGERLPGEEPAPRSEPAWPEPARPPAAPATPVPDAPPLPPPERPLAVAAAAPASAAPRPEPAVVVTAPSLPGPQPPAARSARVLVRVLEAVEPFTASDLRTYKLGPQDVVALPREAAKALVLHGKATYVTGG